MTITDHERDMHRPMSHAEREEYRLQRQKVAQKILQMGELTPEQYAHAQAVGMVDHLQQFLRGKEETFRKYFVVTDAFHRDLHDAFWEETELRFPVRQEISLQGEDEAKLIEFIEYGAGISVRKQYDSEGDLFGVLYEGYTTPNTRPEWSDKVTEEILGKIAAGIVMG